MLRGRAVLAAASLVLAGVSLLRLAQEIRWRRAATRLAAAAVLETARPETIQAMSLEPAGDLAAAFAVSGAVDRRGPAASGEIRRAARALMFEAVAARPGWAYHRYLLARADDEPAGERARRSLRLAAKGAPGDETFWITLAKANLESWKRLSAPERAEAPEAFGRAMESEDFVSAEYPGIETLLGREKAAALLPSRAAVQSAAAGSLAARGDVSGAAGLLERAQQAERRERAQELVDLERRLRLGDKEGLRAGCREWFDRHPFREQDDTEGRRQLARLLALWPDDRFGPWTRDRRGRLVKFFLDGRTADVPPETLLRTVGALTGVPEAVQARVMVAAGKVAAAKALAHGEDASLEWDPYHLEAARRELGAGRAVEARDALSNLTFGARIGCEALLLKRDVALALQGGADAAAVEGELASLREPSAADWASRGSVPLCIDPKWSRGRVLEISAGPGSPALLAWGWDGGRAATLLLPAAETSFRVPLDGLLGRRTLWTSFLAGDSSRQLHAAFRGAS